MPRRSSPAAARSVAQRPVRVRHDGITPERQRMFIEALASTGSVTEAAKACGLSRQAVYAYRNRSDVPAFRQAWDVAMGCALVMLGDVAMSRAVDGVEEPVFWKGEQVGTRRRYNDNLLMTLLRVRDPFGWAPQTDLKHFNASASYSTRPKLDGALDALGEEAAGTFEHAYDDDPGGVIDPDA